MKLSDAINDLKNYEIYKMALYNATDAIAECDKEMKIQKPITYDHDAVQDGANRQEERLICLIDRKERLKMTATKG